MITNIVVNLCLKVLNSDISYTFHCSKNAKITFEEKSHLKVISINIYVIFRLDQSKPLRVSLWIAHSNICMEGNNWNYAYSPFKGTANKNVCNIIFFLHCWTLENYNFCCFFIIFFYWICNKDDIYPFFSILCYILRHFLYLV